MQHFVGPFIRWNLNFNLRYRKITSSRLSWLVAHPRIFRLFMKGNFDAYALWPLDKTIQNWIVDRSTARNFTVYNAKIRDAYWYQFGCGILKWWVLKSKIFGQESTYSKETIVFWGIRGAPVCQQLGMILENKVVQKLKLEKNVFYKKMVS